MSPDPLFGPNRETLFGPLRGCHMGRKKKKFIGEMGCGDEIFSPMWHPLIGPNRVPDSIFIYIYIYIFWYCFWFYLLDRLSSYIWDVCGFYSLFFVFIISDLQHEGYRGGRRGVFKDPFFLSGLCSSSSFHFVWVFSFIWIGKNPIFWMFVFCFFVLDVSFQIGLS